MQPTQELIDELYREQVLEARRTPPGEKLLAGPELFERSCEFMKAGIRMRHPQADEAEVGRLLLRQLERLRRAEIAS